MRRIFVTQIIIGFRTSTTRLRGLHNPLPRYLKTTFTVNLNLVRLGKVCQLMVGRRRLLRVETLVLQLALPTSWDKTRWRQVCRLWFDKKRQFFYLHFSSNIYVNMFGCFLVKNKIFKIKPARHSKVTSFSYGFDQFFF